MKGEHISKVRRYASALTLYLCLAVVAAAQPRCSMTHYSVEDGLSEGTVLSMLQSRDGFLWFGTFDGLNRFDGYGFRVYKAGFRKNNGLTNNRIDRIVEDDLGFLWLMSNDGELHRFNTVSGEFISFSEMSRSAGISISPVKNFWCLDGGETWVVDEENRYIRVVSAAGSARYNVGEYHFDNDLASGGDINYIYKDKNQAVWFLTSAGLGCLAEGDQAIVSVTAAGERTAGVMPSFYCVREFDDRIWFGTTAGRVMIWNKNDATFTQLGLNVSSAVVGIHPLNQRELLLLTAGDGFFVYNTLNGDTRHFTREQYPALPSNTMISAYIDRFGEAWIESPADGVTHFDPFTGDIRHFRMKTEKTNPNVLLPSFVIFEDIHDNLWVYPRGGGFAWYDRKEKSLSYFFNEPGDAARWFPNLIHSAMSDSQGNLWICTISRGLEKITFYPSQFTSVQPKPVAAMHSENEVRALFEDRKNNLWVATKDGSVYLLNQKRQVLGTLRENGTFTSGTPFNGLVYSIIEDRKGNIWMGSKGRGIFRLSPSGGGIIPSYTIVNYRHEGGNLYSLSHDNVYSLFEDTYGRIWAGTFNGGLNCLEQEDGKIRFINPFNQLKNYPFSSHKRVRYVTSDFSNNILVGTTNGLVYFDQRFTNPSEIVFRTCSFDPGDESSLANNDIHFIYCSRENEIYLATYGGGLNRITSAGLAEKKPAFRSFTEANGAPDDVVLSIVDDMNGNLWLSCQRGILKFSRKEESFEIYGPQSGVESRYFSESTGIRTAAGEIIMGYDNGMYCFNPISIRKMSTIPPLVITRVQVSGIDINSYGMFTPAASDRGGSNRVVMQSREKTLTLEYAALDYRNPNNIQYAHKLEGFDSEWTINGSYRIASYNNLEPGEYTFRVKSTNSDGIWVENEYYIPVIVRPSFWQTVVARILFAVLFLAVVALVIYIITTFYKLRHKVEVEQLITNMKLKFFTDISHELRTPLTLIASPVANILRNNSLEPDVKEQLSIVQSNTDRMLRLVNQILDFRKIQNNKMRLKIEQFPFADYVREVSRNFIKVAEEKGIRFEIDDHSDGETLWADKDKIEKIVYNLLSNAFKFTPAGRSITVTISKRDGRLNLVVADEGTGLTKEKMKNLFTRFDSGSGRSISLQPGTGIGLSLTRELAEMHSAEINAVSEEGKGATFTVSFLTGCAHYETDTEFVIADGQKPASLPARNSEESAAEDATEDNEPVLLIVEDNEELRSFLKIILSDGFHVIEAGNGSEGLQIAMSQLPDIIITDLMMPGMSGLELAGMLKNDETTSHIPVIILTARTDLDSQLEALKKGADDFITKPFSSTYLRARVDNILRQRKRLQEIFLANMPAYNGNNEKKSFEITPRTPAVESYDDKLLKNLMQIMEENMDNSELTVDDLVSAIGIGRSVFFKKLKSLTGLAPIEFIREVRIKRAAQLIETGQFTISQVTYMVGNNDPRYFSRIFKQKYGLTPTEYREKHAGHKN